MLCVAGVVVCVVCVPLLGFVFSCVGLAQVLQQLAKSAGVGAIGGGDEYGGGGGGGGAFGGGGIGIEDAFPKDMPRAATQSPIPMPPSDSH